MKTVSFINRGLIDLRAIRTFGMSAKEFENPIGFFGTGFKYAVAICLRLGCEVTLWRGLDRYDFTTSPQSLRGVPFDVVYINGEELAFTTELGKTWEPWQAFRELYCNALDERGSVHDGDCDPADEHTTIRVRGEEFHKAFMHRDLIVLQATPQWETPSMHIHQRSSGHGYYRGIRAADLPQQAAMTYNVRSSLELTEDRTVKNIYCFHSAVVTSVLQAEDPAFVRAFLTAPTGTYEQSLGLDGWTTPNEIFLATVEELGFRACTNNSALTVYKKHRKVVLKPDAKPLNKVEEIQLSRAVRFCEFIGYPVREYPIVVTADLDEHIWGCAYEGTIFINRSAFSHGTKVVAGTLIEEYVHLRHKLRDESRELQNHLLNALVSMGELAMGEPV